MRVRLLANGKTVPIVVTAALLVAASCLVGSYVACGWWQDFLLNSGFLVGGALFAALIVDQLVKRHEERLWIGVMSVALVRIRRISAHLLYKVAWYTPDEDPMGNFFVSYSHVRIDPLNWVRILYEDDDWIAYIRETVIPGSQNLIAALGPEQLADVISDLTTFEHRLRDSAILFSGVLSPAQLENITAIIDQLPVELAALRHQQTGADNFTPASLTDILSRSLALVEESNRREERPLPRIW